MSEKYKKTRKYLNYVEHLFILASTVTGCVLISLFASLVATPVGITRSLLGLKICAITTRIKKYKPIIKKKKKRHNKIVLLGKAKLDFIEVLISKSYVESYITHDKFVIVNLVLRAYNEMKKKNKKNWKCGKHYIKTMETYCINCKKKPANEN